MLCLERRSIPISQRNRERGRTHKPREQTGIRRRLPTHIGTCVQYSRLELDAHGSRNLRDRLNAKFFSVGCSAKTPTDESYASSLNRDEKRRFCVSVPFAFFVVASCCAQHPDSCC